MTTKVYISGPMTGRPDKNIDEFNKAEDQLLKAGYEVLNPTSNGLADTALYEDHMRADLRMLTMADALAFLPDWEKSRGARLEIEVAHVLNIPTRPVSDYAMGTSA